MMRQAWIQDIFTLGGSRHLGLNFRLSHKNMYYLNLSVQYYNYNYKIEINQFILHDTYIIVKYKICQKNLSK